LVLGGVVIGWSPFLLFEVRHHFPNSISLFNFIFHGKEMGLAEGGVSRIIDVVYRLYGRLVTNNEAVLAWGLLLFTLSWGGYYWWCSRRDRREFLNHSLLGIWLVVGVCLFIFYRKAVYDYYLGFMFSLPFLLTALFLTRLKKWGWLIWFVLIAVNLRGIPFRYQPNRQLRQTEEIARFIFDKVIGQKFNFALVTGNNSDHAYRYFFEIWGNSPVTILNSQEDPGRKTVTDQLWVICETLPCAPEGHSLWEIAGFGRAKVVGEWLVAVVKIYRLEHYYGDE
jgi:hypothetical protein